MCDSGKCSADSPVFLSTPSSITCAKRASIARSQDTGRGWPLHWYHPHESAVLTRNLMLADTSCDDDWETVDGSTTSNTAIWVYNSVCRRLATPIQYKRFLSDTLRIKYIQRAHVVPRRPNIRSGMKNRLPYGQTISNGYLVIEYTLAAGHYRPETNNKYCQWRNVNLFEENFLVSVHLDRRHTSWQSLTLRSTDVRAPRADPTCTSTLKLKSPVLPLRTYYFIIITYTLFDTHFSIWHLHKRNSLGTLIIYISYKYRTQFYFIFPVFFHGLHHKNYGSRGLFSWRKPNSIFRYFSLSPNFLLENYNGACSTTHTHTLLYISLSPLDTSVFPSRLHHFSVSLATTVWIIPLMKSKWLSLSRRNSPRCSNKRGVPFSAAFSYRAISRQLQKHSTSKQNIINTLPIRRRRRTGVFRTRVGTDRHRCPSNGTRWPSTAREASTDRHTRVRTPSARTPTSGNRLAGKSTLISSRTSAGTVSGRWATVAAGSCRNGRTPTGKSDTGASSSRPTPASCNDNRHTCCVRSRSMSLWNYTIPYIPDTVMQVAGSRKSVLKRRHCCSPSYKNVGGNSY